MNQIQLHHELYRRAQQRAAEAGFASVDDYVAEIVGDDLRDEHFDHLFTPERIADLDRILREIQAGAKTYDTAEVDVYLQNRREARGNS